VNGIGHNIFYDTSVLAYAFDISEHEKSNVSIEIIKSVSRGIEVGIISNQVLAELFFVLTSKFEHPLSAEVASEIINDFVNSEKWRKIEYTSETVKRAAFTCRTSKTEFWDTLIAETMKEHGISKIITENVKDFDKIPGLEVINPFAKK
jgi:predicted nucleic acid-binding protein